jgi:hypothetical protein
MNNEWRIGNIEQRLRPSDPIRHSPFAYFNRSISAIAAAGARILPL